MDFLARYRTLGVAAHDVVYYGLIRTFTSNHLKTDRKWAISMFSSTRLNKVIFSANGRTADVYADSVGIGTFRYNNHVLSETGQIGAYHFRYENEPVIRLIEDMRHQIVLFKDTTGAWRICGATWQGFFDGEEHLLFNGIESDIVPQGAETWSFISEWLPNTLMGEVSPDHDERVMTVIGAICTDLPETCKSEKADKSDTPELYRFMPETTFYLSFIQIGDGPGERDMLYVGARKADSLEKGVRLGIGWYDSDNLAENWGEGDTKVYPGEVVKITHNPDPAEEADFEGIPGFTIILDNTSEYAYYRDWNGDIRQNPFMTDEQGDVVVVTFDTAKSDIVTRRYGADNQGSGDYVDFLNHSYMSNDSGDMSTVGLIASKLDEVL